MDRKEEQQQADIERRRFLKQFAVTSVLVWQATTGISCSDGPEPAAAYGPEPVVEYGPSGLYNEVLEMWYLLPDGSRASLYDQTDTPVDIQFVIVFSDPMAVASQQAVELKDDADQLIDLQFEWNSDQTELTATPLTALQDNTMYTLSVKEEALTAGGDPVELTQNAQANFKTADS